MSGASGSVLPAPQNDGAAVENRTTCLFMASLNTNV